MKVIKIEPNNPTTTMPYGYATGRNGSFEPRQIQISYGVLGVVRLDVYSKTIGKRCPLVLALYPEYTRQLGEALIEACEGGGKVELL